MAMNATQERKQLHSSSGPDYEAFSGLSERELRWWESALGLLRGRSKEEVLVIATLVTMAFIVTTMWSRISGPPAIWEVAGIVSAAALCPISTAVVLLLSRKQHAKAEEKRTDDTS